MKRLIPLLFAFAIVTMGAEGCGGSGSEAQQQAREDVEQLADELYAEVGTPEINNFQEFKVAKEIMELRDQELTTWTYIVDRDGQKHLVCKSLGYGLPYSTQLTNPEKTIHEGHGGDHSLPQREPNGLYMPDNVSATWVLCQDDSERGYSPQYVEPRIMVLTSKAESLE